jgi:hypothetical protein
LARVGEERRPTRAVRDAPAMPAAATMPATAVPAPATVAQALKATYCLGVLFLIEKHDS